MHGRYVSKALAAAAALVVGLGAHSATAEIKVAVTIKPVHSLVAAVMGDTGKPALLLEGPASPHVAALRPSQARIIENADVVFAVGEGLEGFLQKLMEGDGGAKIVGLAEAPGIRRLAYRDAAGDRDEAEHGHGHEEHDEGQAGDDHDHEHGDIDPHVWLDPDNAKAMARHIAAVLSAADAANAQSYSDNAEAVLRDLDALKSDLAARLAPVRGRPFLVFHDAYQYLEARFGLNGMGSIVLNPETPPGARRLMEVRHRIDEAGVACVFSEPQFEIGYVTTVLEGTDARSASLDPLGVHVTPGPQAYSQVLVELADAMVDCLTPR